MALAAADPACPFLIQHEGKPIFDFEKSWKSACRTAGIPNALYHDLRRTALTNMIEAGFSEKEAMEISGHKTRAVFDRYHIVSSRRLKELGWKMEAHLNTLDSLVQDKIRRLSKMLKTLVSRAGLEPATTALKVRCSTN